MKTLISAIFLLAFAITSNAQLNKPVHKLYLASGIEVSGEHLLYSDEGRAFFSLDNQRYETNEVLYFQNNHGYFANLYAATGKNTESYALRIKKGKMSLYEKIDMEVYGGDELKTELENGGKVQDPLLASGKIFEFYEMRGTQQVRKANYSNLKVDMSDNEKSMGHLKTYRNYRLLQWAMMGVGSGIIAANVIRQSGGPVSFNPVMALGFVVVGGSYFMETPKRDALWLAADAYNEEEPVVVK